MSSPASIPDIVTKALKNSGKLGFLRFTLTETGRLFATLAASSRGVIGEYGTGAGVGAAWLRHGAPTERRVVTLEPDPMLHQKAVEAFSGENIQLINADWQKISHYGPFGLLHISLRNITELDRDEVASMIEPRGMLVIDDFVPSYQWPPTDYSGVDYVRQEWLLDKRFISVDVAVAEDVSVVIATKLT